MMETKIMITTFDNPFDPFEQFTLWDLFDKDKGYNSWERVVKLANFTDDMSLKEEDEEIERAIDKLISIDPLNMWKKLKKEVKIIVPMEEINME